MALSEDEQRKLDEMEIELSRDDPAFAASVSIDRARRRRRIMVTAGFIVGMVVLIGGLVTTAETIAAGVVISMVGVLLMIGAGIAVFRWRHPS